MCVGHMMHMKHMKHMKFEKGFFERTAGANAVQRMGYELLPPSANSFHRLRAVPLPRRGRSWGRGIGSWQNVGGRAMRAPTTLREIATVRCVCNAGLHHCNGWMHLQPSVASPYSVGARIARPFISDVITTFRASARRVIGATAKPLYAIDGKAGGLDRRSPQTSLLEGGGPPQRWKE